MQLRRRADQGQLSRFFLPESSVGHQRNRQGPRPPLDAALLLDDEAARSLRKAITPEDGLCAGVHGVLRADRAAPQATVNSGAYFRINFGNSTAVSVALRPTSTDPTSCVHYMNASTPLRQSMNQPRHTPIPRRRALPRRILEPYALTSHRRAGCRCRWRTAWITARWRWRRSAATPRRSRSAGRSKPRRTCAAPPCAQPRPRARTRAAYANTNTRPPGSLLAEGCQVVAAARSLAHPVRDVRCNHCLPPRRRRRGFASLPQHTLVFYVYNSKQSANRWAHVLEGGASIIVEGVTLDDGAVTAKPTLRPKNILFYGDSITEGVNAECENPDPTCRGGDLCANAATKTWGPTVAAALGAEYSQIGFGSLGWAVSGAGGVPALFTPGNDAKSSWNKVYDGTARDFTGCVPATSRRATPRHAAFV